MRTKNKGKTRKMTSSVVDPASISCTTFNILAPIYKRLSHEDQSLRESDVRGDWMDRNKRILDWLLSERSSIICLQEFWVGNEELAGIYDKRLRDAGYINYKLGRTNNRGDGLLTAVHKDHFRVLNHREVLFNDFSDRVAQLLHVELISPFSSCQDNSNIRQDILIVNTHLLFPHDSSMSLERLRQVYKILQYVESYQREDKLKPLPIILCGDCNGSKRGYVYEFIRSQGFVSSYDTAHQYADADAHKWVSHRNHRGNICGVDFIWLLNPNKYRKLLETSWSEAVFGMFKYLLRRASSTADDGFAYLKGNSDGGCITYSRFHEALSQLNLIGHCYGLSVEEVMDLWVQADIEGNGVLDYKEFQNDAYALETMTLQQPISSEQGDGASHNEEGGDHGTEETIGFVVKNAVLCPTEVEKGTWPEDYSLSDHAKLTVMFSPVRIMLPCSTLCTL